MPLIDSIILGIDGAHTPPATPSNCSTDISSDDSATAFKYSSAVKGVPALSDNLAIFSAVNLVYTMQCEDEPENNAPFLQAPGPTLRRLHHAIVPRTSPLMTLPPTSSTLRR